MISVDANPDVDSNKAVIRIDGAHRLAGATATVDAPAEVAAVAVSDEAAAEQMQVQAGQLPRHLQARRREVDYRESQLNAGVAQLENYLRLSRLWMSEQSQE